MDYLWIVLIFMLIHILSCIANEELEKKVDRKYVKCLVCQKVIEELAIELDGISHQVIMSKWTGYDLDSKARKSTIEKRHSEIFLFELFERLCNKMADYVRGINKSTGQVEVIPILANNGKMNPLFSNYDFLKDGDLEGLEFYCESILSEYDEELIRIIKSREIKKESAGDICVELEACKNYIKNEQSSKDEF